LNASAQEAIVEIFRVLERLTGKPPSNAAVFRIAREDVGVRFMDGEAKALLAKFRENVRPGGAPSAPLARPASAPEIEHERTSSAPEPPLARPSSAGASRARDKVFLVPNPNSNSAAREVIDLSDLDDEPPSLAITQGKEIDRIANEIAADVFDQGIATGLIPAHEKLNRAGQIYADLADAKKLLATYGEAAVRAAAIRLLAACKAGKIHKRPSLRTLGAVWSWREVAASQEGPSGATSIYARFMVNPDSLPPLDPDVEIAF